MRIATVLVLGVVPIALVIVVTATIGLAAETPGAVEATTIDPGIVRWGLLAGAISAGLAALAAGYAVAHVGSAAVGALAEKPEMLGRVLIIVGLAEGIAIYGLIVAVLIFNRVA